MSKQEQMAANTQWATRIIILPPLTTHKGFQSSMNTFSNLTLLQLETRSWGQNHLTLV